MINDNIEEAPPEEVKQVKRKNNFGEGLKQAREAAGLSVGDIAEKLIVSTDIINAIDHSQADALPALAFTQGYIRSYARIVDLSADDIIEAYNSIVPETKKMTTPQSVLLVRNKSSDALVKIITAGFVVAGLIALIMWVYQTDFSQQFTATETESGIEQNSQTPKPRLQLRSEQVLEQLQQQQTILTEENANVELLEESASVSIEMASEQQAVSIDEPDTVKSTPVVTLAETLEPELEKTQVSGTDELMLTANGDSWCEVQDANGQRLYYQLLTKGNEANVKGMAPFKVFLGNAPDVRVEVNKKIVRFEHLINRNSKIANLNIEADAKVIQFYNR